MENIELTKTTKIDNALIGIESVNEDDTVTAVISTINLNRNGYIINQLGGKYDNYLKNPVVLAHHDMTLKPIGRSYGFNIRPEKTIAQIEFNQTLEGQDHKYLYKNKIMRGFSVGIMPIDFSFNEDGTLNINSWDLLEISAVSVPADPDTLVLQNCIKGVKSTSLKKVFENQLLGLVMNDLNKLKEINLDELIENKLKAFGEKFDNYEIKINQLNEIINQLMENKKVNEFKKIIELKDSIESIKNNYKKINKKLETYL